MFITGCSSDSSGNNNVGGSSAAAEVATNLVVTASSYEVPVNTSVKLNAYTISGANHAIDEVTSAANFRHDKDSLLSSFSKNDIVASDNTVKYSKVGTYTVYAHYGEYTSPKITIKVVDAAFEKIVINSLYTTVPAGQNIRLTATGFFYERDILKAVDITKDVDWVSANSEVLTATTVKGEYKANVTGNSTVNISWKNLTDKLDFNVIDDPRSSLVLVASHGNMVLGSEQRIIAMAYYANGAAYDVSGQVNYNIMPADAASIRVDAKDSNIVWLTAKEAKPITITASYTDSKHQAMVSVNSLAVEVSDVALTGLRLAPEEWAMGIGQNYIPSVVGIYNDGSNSDVTKKVSLTSSNADVVTINNHGDGIHARGVGSALIAARLGNIETSNKLKVEVEDSKTSISQIKILASSGSLAVGGIKQQYSAVAVYTNGGTADISNDPNVVWQIIGDNDIAQINSLSGLLTTGDKTGDVRVEIDYAGKIDSVGLSVVNEKVVSLTISASGLTLPLGNKLQYNATAHYNSGRSSDVTNSVIWRSESPVVAVIEPHTGTLTALNAGTSNVSASLNSADGGAAIKSNTLEVRVVNEAAIQLKIYAPANSLPVGGVSQQYKAYASYGNGEVYDVTTSANINWSVSGAAPAAIIDNLNHKGLLTTSPTISGTVVVNAKFNDIVTNQSLVVEDRQPRQLVISASESTLPIGVNQQYKAYAIYDNFEKSDVTSKVVWSIDNTELAMITSTGVVTTKELGTVIISASLPNTKLVTNSDLNIVKRKQVSLVLSPSHAILPIRLTQRYHAIAFYDNGESADVSSSVNWSSSEEATAMVNNGLATGIGSGNTIISASLNGQTATGNLTINNATLKNIKVIPTSLELALNATYQLNPIGSYDNVTQQELSGCNWKSSNTAVVTVDPSNGAIIANGLGNALITATCSGKEANSSSIKVVNAKISSLQMTPTSVSVAVGNTANMDVVASYNNGDQQILTDCSWTSDNTNIATVVNGVVTGKENGVTSVNTICNGQKISATVTVQAATIKMVQITPMNVALPYKSQYQLRAIASYDNGTQGDVTDSCQWSSNNTLAVSVQNGLLKAQTTSGRAQISASCDDGSKSSTPTATVTVNAANLESATINPSSAIMAEDTQQKLEVIGSYANLDQALISEKCAWSSSAPSIASVENTTGSKGIVRALSSGNANITATCPNTKSVTATIAVRDAVLKRVLISPESINLPVNTGYQLNAIGTYDNMTQQKLTNCLWNKHADSAASNLTVNQNGQILTGNITGTANIDVTCHDIVAKAQVTVNNKSLKSVTVSPSEITIPIKTNTPIEVIGIYNDNSSLVQSSGCTLNSDNNHVSVTSNDGKFSIAGDIIGSSKITATCGAFSSSGKVNVVAGSLQTLKVIPDNVYIPVNTSYQLQAFGSHDDYSLEKQEKCTWRTIENTGIISVNETTGGVSAGTVAGVATVQANCKNKIATSTITVKTKALSEILISPSSKSLIIGESFPLHVIGTYDDKSIGEITNGCSWTSGNPSIVSVNNGVVTAVEEAGVPVNITANCSGKSATVAITVKQDSSVTLLINDSASTNEISSPVGINSNVKLSFRANGGDIKNLELISFSHLPLGWSRNNNSSAMFKCDSIVKNSSDCSIELTYQALNKNENYKGTLNLIYKYTNNLGVVKYGEKHLLYKPSNRMVFYTNGGKNGIGRCMMDNNDMYVETSTCEILEIRDLNNKETKPNTSTGIKFYNGFLYFVSYHPSKLYKCNVDSSNVLRCNVYPSNMKYPRGIFIDSQNILVSNTDYDHFSRFSTTNPVGNDFISASAATNDIVIDKDSSSLFASVYNGSNGKGLKVMGCNYNPFMVGEPIQDCMLKNVEGIPASEGDSLWGIGVYKEVDTNNNQHVKSHLYLGVTTFNLKDEKYKGREIIHCEIGLKNNQRELNNCSAITIRGAFANRKFIAATKIDIIGNMAYVLEHGHSIFSKFYGIYQCTIDSPEIWICSDAAVSRNNSALENVEMMSVTGVE